MTKDELEKQLLVARIKEVEAQTAKIKAETETESIKKHTPQ